MVNVTASAGLSEARAPHALLLGASIAPFLGATLADVAYATTYEIQWQNFASWLLVGGLLASGIALLLAVVDLARASRGARGAAYAGVLAVAWLIGLLSALAHARDAWASMPGGLVLSAIATTLVCVAAWLATAREGRRA